ncbi:RYamide receptor [Folsomia candida]|uniref:RYamide receptor n=1 Tax=Folsomia candida TaxID=158441 RepID=UPI001604F720|nr:RYamide receptor [Folsomia candida]XP_035709980.1 RYamide receptor [Folsomia candida]
MHHAISTSPPPFPPVSTMSSGTDYVNLSTNTHPSDMTVFPNISSSFYPSLEATESSPAEDAILSFPPYFQLVVYILYNTIFVAAVIGNTLVIYVVVSSARMRTVTNYLICNLAVGDLLMAILSIPFSYISVLYQYWPFGLVLCHLVSYSQATCVFVSAYTLIVLALDRYFAILYPLQPRLRRSQALGVICGVWVVALITAIPIAVFTRLEVDEGRAGGLPLCEESAWSDDTLRLAYSLTLMFMQYFLPVSVLIFTYSRIAIAVWGKKAPGEAEDNRDQRLARAKRKMIKMMLTVVIAYTLSWLPFNCLIILLNTVPPTHALFTTTIPPDQLAILYFTCHFLSVSHSVVNPVIYSAMNSNYRQAFASATRRISCVSKLFYDFEADRNRLRLQRSGTVTTTYTFQHGGHGGVVLHVGGGMPPPVNRARRQMFGNGNKNGGVDESFI